uniref:Uncharacterized protein n=1 Tax=Amphilophus citrinellus TaxID=61819 RepID=A0A3Q0RPH2_AMPCI
MQEPKVEQLMGKLRRLKQGTVRLGCNISCLQLNKKSEELLEQYRYEIQELKLKHRKQRMKFENQLDQLIEQHKNLLYVFTPERLPDELEGAQNTKSQLLAAGKHRRALFNLVFLSHHIRKKVEQDLGKKAHSKLGDFSLF